MATTPTCPQCKKAEFVRFETVIHAGTRPYLYSCENCCATWALNAAATSHSS
jgi:uncharacterized Zn finger protein